MNIQIQQLGQIQETKNTACGDVFCWHLGTVWINIDRERASPSKRRLQYSIFRHMAKEGVKVPKNSK
jgi:hypothetical protein